MKTRFLYTYKRALQQWKMNNDKNHPRSAFRVIHFIAFNPKNQQQLTPETANTRYSHYTLCIHTANVVFLRRSNQWHHNIILSYHCFFSSLKKEK